MNRVSAAAPRLGQRRRRETGAALIELAIALPVLAVLLVGTIDFGRVFRLTMIVQNAARAGALYGAQSSANAANTTNIRIAGNNVLIANSLPTLNAVAPVTTCECANDAGTTFTATLNTGYNCTNASTCAVGSHLVESVAVTVTQNFSMTGAFSPFPASMTIVRTAKMRVLN